MTRRTRLIAQAEIVDITGTSLDILWSDSPSKAWGKLQRSMEKALRFLVLPSFGTLYWDAYLKTHYSLKKSIAPNEDATDGGYIDLGMDNDLYLHTMNIEGPTVRRWAVYAQDNDLTLAVQRYDPALLRTDR